MSRQGEGGQPPGTGVAARGLGVKGPRGWAFRDVTFEAGQGALVAVTGPTGSGRTALLLALTGRMRTAEGSARVAGLDLPRRMARVRRVSGVAHVSGVTDLDPALTVAEHLRERALVGRRYGGPAADLVRGLLRSPRARAAEDAARADAALQAVGLAPGDLPKGDRTAVRDLSRAQELRLSVALALLGRPGRPEVIAVDDADLGLSGPEREEAITLLSSLAAGGTTVLAAFREAPPEADLVVPVGDQVAPEDLPPASGRLLRLLRRGARATAVAEDAGATPAGPGDGTAARPTAPGAAEDEATRADAAAADDTALDGAASDDITLDDTASGGTASDGAGDAEVARKGERATSPAAPATRPADPATRTAAPRRTASDKATARGGDQEPAGADDAAAGTRTDAAGSAATRTPAPSEAGPGEATDEAAESGRAATAAPGDDPQEAVEAPTAEEDADAHPATGRA